VNHALNWSEDGSRLVGPEADFPDLYADRVGCSGGALPGSYLTDQHHDRHGARWTIQLAAGRQTSADAILAAALIGSALDRSLTDVAIDPHPSGDLSRAVLLVAGAGDDTDAGAANDLDGPLAL
jgi:hypothetical protein